MGKKAEMQKNRSRLGSLWLKGLALLSGFAQVFQSP
jgi:hypothetical protein